jgi:hypothetical protein
MDKSERDVRHTFQLYRSGSMARVTITAALATILLGAGWVHLGEAANQVGGSDHTCWWVATMTTRTTPTSSPPTFHRRRDPTRA